MVESLRIQLVNADATAKAIDYILMSLIKLAKPNGHDAWAYLKDVLTKLPTWPNSRLAELLPHRWVPPTLPDRLPSVKMGWRNAYPASVAAPTL